MTVKEMFFILKELRKNIKTDYDCSIVLYNGEEYLEWKVVKENMSGTADTGISGITTFLKEKTFENYKIDGIKLTSDDEIVFVFDSHDGYQPYCFERRYI